MRADDPGGDDMGAFRRQMIGGDDRGIVGTPCSPATDSRKKRRE